jgi:hypothetical protein
MTKEMNTCEVRLPKSENWFRRLMFSLLRMIIFLLTGFALYVWCAVSCKGLIRRDTIEAAVSMGGPINHFETLFCCFSPIGWFLALGVLGLASVMTLIIYRWPWPLRIIIAAMVPSWLMYYTANADLTDPWARTVLMWITGIQILLAVLAAIFCRSAARRFLRDLPEWSRLPFFAGLWRNSTSDHFSAGCDEG